MNESTAFSAGAARGAGQVTSHITDGSHGASETGSAAAQVLASSPSRESHRLKAEVDKFLATVRAA